MLDEVVNLISSSQTSTDDGVLSCKRILLNDQNISCVTYLEENGVVENSDYEKKIGSHIDLELSFARVNSVGYYLDGRTFLRRNRYQYPSKRCYIEEYRQFSDDNLSSGFFVNFRAALELIDAVKSVAKHTYSDSDGDNSIIFRDDRSLFLPFGYAVEHITGLGEKDIDCIRSVSSSLKDTNSEKKLLYINELIDFLLPLEEKARFRNLLLGICEYSDKCENAYQFYLRDYSYNKLKIELDAKSLEFAQKIQTVINDSQTKLVVIPTAFVLVYAAFDYTDVKSIKDLACVVSMFIFSLILQLFLNNQFSILNFTSVNIEAYKKTFKKKNMIEFIESFSLVDSELRKQKNRLTVVAVVLWTIPVSLLLVWIILLCR